LILDPIGQFVEWNNAPKVGHNELHCSIVCVSGTEIFRGVIPTSYSLTWCLLFSKWDRCLNVGYSQSAFFYHPCIRKKNSVIKLLFPKWDRCPNKGLSPNIYFLIVSRLFCHPCVFVKSSQILQNCRKRLYVTWDTGLKWDKTEFDSACVSVVFPCIPLVFYSPIILSRWDIGSTVLACFRPDFIFMFERGLSSFGYVFCLQGEIGFC